MRIKFTTTEQYGSSKRSYISPPIGEEVAKALARAIAESHPISSKPVGDENFLVIDQSVSAQVEIVPDEVAMTPREFANAQATYEEEQAKKAADKAAKKAIDARKAAELVAA